jgi:hypothetical protein
MVFASVLTMPVEYVETVDHHGVADRVEDSQTLERLIDEALTASSAPPPALGRRQEAGGKITRRKQAFAKPYLSLFEASLLAGSRALVQPHISS